MIFNHLHVHTQFSLLDGASKISKLYSKAQRDGMRGLAITDHGNMFGVFNFVAEAWKNCDAAGMPLVKPIVGCEFYLVEDRHLKVFTREQKDKRYHQLLLAKNEIGYKNLCKICSLGYIEGFYGKYPRIDKSVILQYHEGLIATTCCLGAEIPKAIIEKGEEEAEVLFRWWLDVFGEDYYVELQRHKIPEQEKVNEVLLRFAKKYNVTVIASNDAHYVDQEDANAHDILLCVNTGAKQKEPTFKDFGDAESGGGKGSRFAFFNDEFYFKNTQEMTQLFSDIPEAIDNTNAIVDKVEPLNLIRNILLPNFPLPAGFLTQDSYLRHLTYEGAARRYGEITEQITERLEFELRVIESMGFAGYFLIVSDFIKAGRDLGVFVGPGRGSAAGSVVAYCTGITNIDPIKYDLLFERFLNPERKEMPDIDTDFDDEGRQKVIDYVVDKYGRQQVAHIVTYSSMAAKVSIKDVARVLDLPLSDANYMSGLIPDKPAGLSLNRIVYAPLEGKESLSEKEKVRSEDFDRITKLRSYLQTDSVQGNVLREALKLEGSIRGTGIHAAGIIIAPEDLTNLLPLANAKDTDLLVTQFEGNVVEKAGVLKMDFLGLKTLTILKKAQEMVKVNHGVLIDLDSLKLDDEKTFQLFQKGETNGIFQFESKGMQKVLMSLKPDRLEDLIAVNALFRPGPMVYIPEYIDRKFGRKPIHYDLADQEQVLKETYGITVYQEQVMLLSQKLANFTKGQADVIRKAMGKKNKEVLDKMKALFLEGCEANGHSATIAEKIWKDWEAFASYAFNKSHSTCYAVVAYQTAYFKAHYPAEYMAAVLSNNLSDIKKINFFMEECRRMGLPIQGPCVNESFSNFTVNKQGAIRFGLAAIKGVGEGAVESIIDERQTNGPFSSVFDFLKRVNPRTVNKRIVENLVMAGALDEFKPVHRAQYFTKEPGTDTPWVDRLMRWATAYQQSLDSVQQSLFGETEEVSVPSPMPPEAEIWPAVIALAKEKEVTGFYISGHPFDEFEAEILSLSNCDLKIMANPEKIQGQLLKFPAIVMEVDHKMNKMGKPFGIFKLEDYYSSMECRLFGDEYLKFKHYLENGTYLFIHAIYQPRFKGSDEWALKINKIELLQELGEKNKLKGELEIDLSRFKAETLNDVREALASNPGHSPLWVKCVDIQHGQELLMKSEFMVSFSKKFTHTLKRIEGVKLAVLPQK